MTRGAVGEPRPETSADAAGAPAATVTLDVWRLRPRDAVRAMAATPSSGRRQVRRSTSSDVSGSSGNAVRFAKVLGTGGTGFTTRSADLTRWVALTVWDSPVTTAPAPPPWARHAVDHWSARLAPLTSRGRWSGESPFAAPGRSVAAGWDGEVLALTRARLAPRGLLRFWRAVPPVAASMRGADGLVATMGMGEAPVGFQGTLSLWRDSKAVAAFAWRDPAHRAVVDRTPREHWYAEELFARFAVLDRTAPVTLWADRPGRPA